MYITINSEFRPFTYDELTKPLNDYTEAYNKVEEQYTTLAQQTEAWKNIANQENSPEAYAMYKKYSDELNTVVEDFSRGMTIQNRSKLAGLKSRYASEIEPIAVAARTLENLRRERAEEERSNPSLRYERGVNDITLDTLIRDPFANYGKTFSGSLLETQARQAASALADSVRSNPSNWTPILGGQYYQQRLQNGYTPEEILLASIGDPNAPEELSSIANSIIQNSGIESWNGFYDSNGNITDRGNQLLNEVRGFIGRGLTTAIGKEDYNRLENKNYDYTMRRLLAQEEWEREHGGDTGRRDPLPPMNDILTGDSLNTAALYNRAFGNNAVLPIDTYIETNYSFTPSTPEELFEGKLSIPEPNYTFVNPIKEYEDYINNESKVFYSTSPMAPYQDQPEYTRKHNTTLLTEDQYNALLDLGYTAESTKEDFINLSERINNKIQITSPVELNLGDYTREGELLSGILNEDNIGTRVYNYTNDGTKGESADYDDIFNVSSDGTVSLKNPITQMGVDPNNFDYLILTMGGKQYYINALSLFPGLKSEIQDHKAAYNDPQATNQQKVDALQSLGLQYQSAMNYYRQRAPKTSSQKEFQTQ